MKCKNPIRKIQFTAILLLFTNVILAQNCEFITKSGVYNTRNDYNEIDSVLAYRNWYCHNELYKDSKKIGLSGDLVTAINAVPLKIASKLNGTTNEEKGKNFCSEITNNQEYQSLIITETKTISDKVFDTLSNCLDSQTGKINILFQYTYNPNVFWLLFNFKSPGEIAPYAKVLDYDLSKNLKCKKLKKKMKVYNNIKAVKCVRKGVKAATIGINTNTSANGPIVFNLPAVFNDSVTVDSKKFTTNALENPSHSNSFTRRECRKPPSGKKFLPRTAETVDKFKSGTSGVLSYILTERTDNNLLCWAVTGYGNDRISAIATVDMVDK